MFHQHMKHRPQVLSEPPAGHALPCPGDPPQAPMNFSWNSPPAVSHRTNLCISDCGDHPLHAGTMQSPQSQVVWAGAAARPALTLGPFPRVGPPGPSRHSGSIWE